MLERFRKLPRVALHLVRVQRHAQYPIRVPIPLPHPLRRDLLDIRYPVDDPLRRLDLLLDIAVHLLQLRDQDRSHQIIHLVVGRQEIISVGSPLERSPAARQRAVREDQGPFP